jgi:hypothetical protein
MGKDWKEREVIYADNLWAQVDEWTREIDFMAENPEVQGSECAKMMLQGRREAISWVTKYLSEYEQSISEILDFWGVKIASDEEGDD